MTEPLIITTSPRDDHQLDLTIALGPERTEKALHRAARKVSQKAKIPGFRPGKAPDATVFRMFGREAVLSEILDDLGDEVFKEALESEKIEPYAQASLHDVTYDPLTFKLVIPLAPTVELGDYRNIRLDAPAVAVSEADVEAALQAERTSRTTQQTVERAAALGDAVLVDIKGTAGAETIMDNHDWQLTLRGEGGWLPGFDEAFVGLSAGEEKSFDLAYPEDSQSKFKGQVATFEVKVKEVKAKVMPEADDEFVKTLGDYTDLADFRAKKLVELTEQRSHEAEAQLNDQAVEALVKVSKIAYPPAAVDNTVHAMMDELESRLRGIGYAMADYLRLQGKTVQQYHDELHEPAERRLQGQLVVAELAQAEQIAVSEAEKLAEVERMASRSESPEQAASLREVFGSEAGLRLIESDLRTDKTLARLRAIVTGQAEAVPAEAAASPAAAEPVAEAPAPTEAAAK